MKRLLLFRCFALIPLLLPTPCWAQASSGQNSLGPALRPYNANIWQVFGHVTTLRGEPLRDVMVRVDIGTGPDSVRVLRTNLQGEFRCEYTLEADIRKRVRVKLIASKDGYLEARETLDFGASDENQGIDIVLREPGQDPNQLSMAELIAHLAPRLRQEASNLAVIDSGREEMARGCEELIGRHNAVGAVPLLSKVVEQAQSCLECRLLLSLALLDGGSWATATRRLSEAEQLNDAAATKRPEPALITGVMEAWRGKPGVAVGSFQKALQIEPDNALGLQEMGRALILQGNSKAADRYLEKAIQAGAGEDARLLRVRALLELGDIAGADHEMGQFVGDRDVKNLPYEARKLYITVQDRVKLAPYARVKSIISQPLQDLMKAFPELEGLRAASDQNELVPVLKKTGEGVQAFFRDFPNTMSLERVHQERLGEDGKVQASLDQEFQYLLLARAENEDLGIKEHRSTPRMGRTGLAGLEQNLMLTTGFASVSLLFEPARQEGTKFRYLGRQVVDGENLHVIAFAQESTTPWVMERFTADKASALILLQGLAWIHPATFQIVRLRTDLLGPRVEVRLPRQTTEIQFAQVSFKGGTITLWLPKEVAVTVDWRGHVYQNWHRYSDFELFNVETYEEMKTR